MPGADKELRKKALGLEPLVMLGKNGLDTAQIEELKTQLKRKKLIKVRMLKSFVSGKNRKALAAEIAGQTNSEIIYAVGSVIVLRKK